ncbi:hypothetical protein HRR99_17935 [Agrobacterium vaccinii]|uniref:hypothetical protein n=1 Tax=Agrobacterium vaccinii TaxID=2735528 RepID=UPI001E2A1541|nr:hypothetical protein [Agrobacterium vaccinii]UHS63457.1 hypothetical protein HRR99_17935 [Agrobacterium vaccinii]
MGKTPLFDFPEAAKHLAEKITDLACEMNFVERPDDEPLFAESYLLHGFDSSRAVQLLSDGAPSFYGHKDAVYAAFCGWIFSPPSVGGDDDDNSDGFILDLVAASVMRLLGEAEEIASELPYGSPLNQDILARYFIAGPQFIEQIYNAICGVRLLNEIASEGDIKIAVSEDYRAESTVLQFIRYCHYWSSNPNLKIKPSVRRGINAVKQEVDPERFWASEAAIYDVWGKMKHTVALRYAASSIVMDHGVLLDEWYDGNFDYKEQSNLVPLLLGRARYVCDHVLAKMHDFEVYAVNVEPLKKVSPIEFDLFRLDKTELASANDKNVNKNRLLQKAKATRVKLNRDKG